MKLSKLRNLLLLPVLASHYALAVNDVSEMELSINSVLTLEEINDTEKCTAKLLQVETNLAELNSGLNLDRAQVNTDGEFAKLICEQIYKSHLEEVEDNNLMIELFRSAGEAIPKALKKTKDSLTNMLSHWEFKVNLSGAVYSGNADYLMAENAIGAVGNFGFQTIKVEAKGQYKSKDENSFKKFNLDVRDEIDLGHYGKLPRNMFGFVGTEFSIDENKGIKNQFDVMGGIGYNLLGPYNGNTDKLRIDLAIGYRFRKNDDNSSVKAPIVSAKIHYEKRISQNFVVDAGVEYIRKIIGSSSDYELDGSTAIKYRLSDDSTVAFRYEQKYDSIPVAGKDRMDSVFKIEYERKF